jgi:hypothetical protein
MNELDEILLEQLHNSMRNRKHLKRVSRLLKNDPVVEKGKLYIEGRIKFFETMIEDKSLLNEKPKRKKVRESDLLAKNPVYEWYRTVMYITLFSYKTFVESATSYMSYFKKDNNEKT